MDIRLIQGMQWNPSSPTSAQPPSKAPDQGSFGALLERVLEETNRLQLEADAAVERLMTGRGENLHQAMIALAKAEVSLQFVIQVRNKMVEAYQELMRMQI